MGKFNGVLVASDFDGTLTDINGQIPDRNTEAIKYFIANGGSFTVSTGRTKAGFHNYRDDIINAPVLLGNGAMAYDYTEEKTVFVNGIKKENCTVLKKILSNKEPLCMECYGADGKSYVFNINDESRSHFKGLKINDYIEITRFDDSFFPFVKVMISAGKRTFEIQDYLRSIDMNTMKFIPCTGSYIEILSEKAGKGSALLQLAEYLGISPTEAYAVGDGSNDVDMLETAALSFAPCNGSQPARDAADIITGSNNNGCIADVIEFLDKKY